jgi:hypothetical protein
MSAVQDNIGISANDPCGKSDAETSRPPPSTGDEPFGVRIDVDPEWFSRAAIDLYPTKGGAQLHFLTAYDERLCQKYVAGSVRPSAYFLRTLLRGRHGEAWLNAIMDGCTAPWWRDLQRAADLGRKVAALTK